MPPSVVDANALRHVGFCSEHCFIGPILLKLQTTGVYHLHADLKEINFLTRPYSRGYVEGIDEIKGDKLIIGEFKESDDLKNEGDTYLVIMNKRHDALKEIDDPVLKTKVSLKFLKGCELYGYSLRNGSPRRIKNRGNFYTFKLGGGQMALLVRK